MPPYMRTAVLIASVVLGLAARVAADEPEPSLERIRDGVTRALPLLVKGAIGHREQRTCFSCHSNGMAVLAMTTARSRGFQIDEDELGKQLQFIADFLGNNRDNYRQGKGQGGAVMTAGSALQTLEAGGWKPDETTSAVAEYLLLAEKDADHWTSSSNRPPSEGSPFAATYDALGGLRAYGTAEQSERVAARTATVREWLVKSPAADTEDRVFRLWALSAAAADQATIQLAADELKNAQQADGGWRQLDSLESDAYATGSALVSLHQAGGLATSDAAYRRGLAFLLQTQLGDGSWHVKSRSKPFQTYFETGYPHEKDQFISSQAAGWATTALALACPTQEEP